MTKAAQRAVDALIADVLDQTVDLGTDRADVLDVVANALKKKAQLIREVNIHESTRPQGS